MPKLNTPIRTTLCYIVFALLALAIVMLHTHHFQGRAYRQDEAWSVQHALENVAELGLIGHVSRIVTEYAAEWFSVDIWVALFGHSENITRFYSTLMTLLGLAFLYRLATDLFNARVGFFGVIVLGTLNFFMHYSHETRPYALLMMTTVGFQFCYLRFLQTTRWQVGALAVFLAVFMLYQHSFMVYVVASHGFVLLFFVRWDVRRYIGSAIIFGASALLYLPRYFIIFNDPRYSGGIEYALSSDAESGNILIEQMMLRPEVLGLLLLLSAVLVPLAISLRHQWNGMRFSSVIWKPAYLVIVPTLILLVAFYLNTLVPSMTPRNVSVILPSLAILVALGIVKFPWQIQGVVLGMIVFVAVTQYEPVVANGSYLEMNDELSHWYTPEDTRILISAGSLWEHVPISYYLQYRMPFTLDNEDLFHITVGRTKHFETIPDPPVNIALARETNDDRDAPRLESNLQALEIYVGDSPKLFWIEATTWDLLEPYSVWLLERYVPYRTVTVGDESHYHPITITEYRRIPDKIETVFQFGDFTIENWQLLNDNQVQPCQTITLESWWQSQTIPDQNYNITVALANADGNGVTQSDGAPSDILTGLWQAEQLYVDERQLTIPCDLAPGDYNLVLGMYALDNPDQRLGETVYLTTLIVE